jgi:hypothetical protein
MGTITKESNVRDVVAGHPATRRVFDRHGLQGCGGELGPNETLEFFAAVHQMDVNQLIRELEQEAQRPGASTYVYRETLPDYIYRRFFKAGVLTVLSVGCLWGAFNLWTIGSKGSFLQLGLLPSIHAHAHAMIFGWIGLFVMGFAYQSFPRFKNTTLWRPELANLSFWLLAAGIIARVVAELWQPAVWAVALAATSAMAEIFAVTLFLLVLYRTARQSVEPHNPYEKFMGAAFLWFFAGTVLSHVFFFAKLTAASQEQLIHRIALIDGPLREIQLLGFAAFIIAGVSQRLVPTIYGFPAPRRDRRSWIFALMMASLLLNIASYVLFLTTRNRIFGIGLELAYIMMPVWAVLLVRQINLFATPERPDRTLKFIRAAYFWLLVSLVMMPLFIPYSLATGQGFAHAYMGAHRHAFTVGFISLMIMGVSAKIVPILAGVDARSLSSLWGPFLLVNIGNALRVSLQLATDFTPVAFPLVGVTGFIEVVGLAWWGIELWRTMNLARTHRPKQLVMPVPLGAR